MCTWITERAHVHGSGKGSAEWTNLTAATVYYDHPQSAPMDHALVIDFRDEARDPSARVVVEMSAASARNLLRAIESALASGEESHAAAAAGESA